MPAYVLSSGPAVEPVSLAEFKLWSRLDDTSPGDEDSLLSGLIASARKRVELLTNRKLINQTWKYILDEFPEGDVIELPFAPISTAGTVKYTDIDGAEATWSSSEYILDTSSEPHRIVLKEDYDWPDPDGGLREANAVEISMTYGYGSAASSVPEPLRDAIKMLAAHMYDNREAASAQELSVMPFGVMHLISPYRLWFRGRNQK